MSKDLKPKNIKNRVKLLRAMRYKNCMVYLRMIGTDLFLWDLVYNNEIYSGNLVITPGKGKTKLSDVEIQRSSALVWAGAVATIDSLLGESSLTGKKKIAAEAIIAANDKAASN